MCLTSRMTDGHTEGSNAESIDSNEAESTQTIVTRVVDMKSCFLAGRFGEACALAKEELQALRDEKRLIDHIAVLEVHDMKVALTSVGSSKDTAASLLLQCAFELNRDGELDIFQAAYRNDVIIYPLFVLWLKIHIHRRHLTAARAVLGETIQQLAALLIEARQHPLQGQNHDYGQEQQPGILYHEMYLELVSILSCYVELPLEGNPAKILDQVQSDSLLKTEEKQGIQAMIETIMRTVPSSPSSLSRTASANGHHAEQNGHDDTMERPTQWPQKPDGSTAQQPGRQHSSQQLVARPSTSSFPSWLSNPFSTTTSSSATAVAPATTFLGRLRQLFGRDAVYHIIATGFAVLAIWTFWFVRRHRFDARRPGNQSITALRNFLTAWLRTISRKR